MKFTARAFSAAAVAGVLATSMVCAPAQADPDAVTQAQEKLARIEEESSAIDARYIQLQSQLDDASAELAQARQDEAAQAKRVTALSKDLGQFAMLRYQTSGVDLTTRLLTSQDEADFLGQLATIQTVTDRANDRVQSLQLAQARLAQVKDEAETTRARIAEDKAEQAAVAKQYQRKEAEARAVLERLTAEEKARLAEIERKKQQAAAKALQEARSRAAASQQEQEQSEDETRAEPEEKTTQKAEQAGTATPTSGSGRASDAISFALSQVGKSYVMGATGPGAYDCSGLMLTAWKQAGVSLPRTSQQQFGAGSQVPTSSLQPGDLVFYYGGISHVGMYIGNGQIVHASNPRTGVKVAPVDSMPIAGARRVG
ncbi:C40 family peptidase [Luteococcus peritonei]|uniref:NlpC/P60 family protein n=1 Tax=Luteococcus peritonei TaxID=88874 RepID=A0ABW4RRC8_9ACTN